MNNGWIKLHRRILEWEWYSDINVTRLFLHILLKANHKDKKYRGDIIQRGQLLTGRGLLSSETGLSEQQIRTCLNKLKSTNDITIKSTSKGTLLTIDNYSNYQDLSDESTNESTSKLTNNQPASNQQVTTNKNVKNVKNVKNDKYIESFDLFWSIYPKKVSKPQAMKAFKRVYKDLELNPEKAKEFISVIDEDCKKRFANTEKQFIPNAATYLNNDRWLDEH